MARFNAPTSLGSESSFPIRRRKGQSRRGGIGRGTNGDVLTMSVLCLVVGIVLLWVVGAYKFLHQLPTSGAKTGVIVQQNPLSSANSVLDPTRDLPEEVYAHWQPPTPSSMECSWRECFKEDHTCSTCRDLLEDFGTPPPVPEHWVPDVTFLRRMRLQGHDANGNPWPPPLDPELCEPIGVFGGKNDDNKLLLDAVPIQALPFSNDPPTTSSDQQQPRLPKIMCMIYTMESKHHLTIRAMRETWASGCDGFLAFSTASDPRIPAIALPHEGPEQYENMWQKIRSIWKFVGTHYLDDFDFFFQGGEDLFILPQNLKQYLATLGPGAAEEDYFVGRRFLGYGRPDNYFNSGGAGYALSRATLRKYITEGYDHPKCNPHKKTSMEDVMIAQCLRDVFNIGLTDTRDDMLRERFHPFSPGSHYSWKPPTEGNRDWYADYNKEWPPLLKEQCCAPDSVSFHYIKKAAMVRHLHALLYECGH